MNAPKGNGKRLSPLKAIRAFCVWCCGGSAHEVNLCPAGPDKRHPCDLWPYRMGGIPQGASRSLMRAIKARCLDCMPDGPADCDASQAYEIHPPCPCWPYRLGRNPNIGEETREKRRERGKRQMNFTAPQPESGRRINPKPVDGGTCGREIQTRLIE
jgi:hypothetical protein